jgi:tetratricopeptide (TPR) repeat protein
LGVLLARSGQLEEARDLLKQSLRVNPATQSWANLAKVHARLNEPQLAQLAKAEFIRTAQLPARVAPEIQWKPMEQFNAEAPIEFHNSVAAKPDSTTGDQSARSNQKADQEKSKSLGQKLKDLF